MNVLSEAKELRRLWGGYWPARVLITAGNLRIFDHLKAYKSAAELAGLIKTDPRATGILLDAVTGLGFLKKSSDKYRNTPVANRLLVTGMPYYQGDILRHADNLWENWSNLEETVRTGMPSRRSFGTDAFIRGMHNIASLKAPEVIKSIDLKGVKKALDLGGGPGTYSIEMAKKVKEVFLFDLPATIAIAKDIIGRTKIMNISFIEGDFLTDSIGEGYDLVFISQVLHSFSDENNLKVIKKAFSALNAGGLIAIQEHLLDPDRTGPVSGSLFSVNMLVNTHGGRSYSVREMKAWLSAAGFRKIISKTTADTSFVFGRKITA
jgi:ubiquinone/menaquinone biosynthesis C-methylase UbiE